MSRPINKTILTEGSIATSPVQQKRQQHTYSLKQSVLDSYVNSQYSSINQKNKLVVFFFEYLGMVLFIFGACSIVALPFADVYIGLAVLVAVIMSGPISGANLNPAVTLCNCLRKEEKLRFKMLPLYYLSQFLGAMTAIVVGELINGAKIGPLLPEAQTVGACFQVVASEAFGTFILIFFLLMVSNPNTTFIDNELSGYLFIVLFVHTGRRYAASSHECINSMVAFTFALTAAIEGNPEGLKYCPLWFAGDFLGTIIALAFYEKLFEPNVEYMRNLRRDYQNKQFQSIIQNHMEGNGIPERLDDLEQI